MKGPGIGIKATALFIALSVIPLSAGGYLLTEASMHELSSKTIEGLTDVVRGKANLYSEEFLNFKEDAESLSKYISQWVPHRRSNSHILARNRESCFSTNP